MARLTIFTGENCRLRLPVRATQASDEALPSFEPAEISPPLATERVRPSRRVHTIEHDHVDGWTTMVQVNDEGRLRFLDNGLETAHRSVETFKVREGDPLSTSERIQSVVEFARDDWQVRVETDSLMTADATHFHLSNHMDAYEGDARVFTNTWTMAIPRNNV
jgi:hypothetical protein